MPLYEYQCESCQHRFERIQKFSDPLVTECPKCGGPVRKLISSPAIQFKGSGWYITDYARQGDNSEKKERGSEKPAAAETASSDATSTSTPAKETSTPAKTESTAKSSTEAKPVKGT